MVLSVTGVVSSRTGWNASRPGGRDQVGVLQRRRIAGGGVDRETEEVCDGSEVAACGIDLVEDAVLAQLPEGNAGSDRQAEPAVAGRPVAAPDELVDEQVVVDRLGPSVVSIGQVGAQAIAHGIGQRDDPTVDGKSAIAD